LQQLRHLGCLETCRIRRQGFPVRREFSQIVEEFGVMIGLGHPINGEGAAAEVASSGTTTMREECVRILASHVSHSQPSDPICAGSTTNDCFRAGTSKVFLRNGVIEILNMAKDNHFARRNTAAVLIQSSARQHWASMQAEKLRVERIQLRGAVVIQAALRGSWGRKRAAEARAIRDMKRLQEGEWNASVKLQQLYRGHLARRCRFIERLRNELTEQRAAVSVQASLRTFVAARSFQRKKNAVSRIASFYRSKRTEEQFIHVRKNAISIQSNIRRALAMKRYRRELRLARRRAAAIVIQKAHRCCRHRRRWATMKAGVLGLQRVFRGHRLRKHVLPFIQIRRAWKHILFPNEVLLRVSYCAKFAGTGISRLMGRKKRRLLFLTSAGRVIYFKHQSAKIKGEFQIDLNDPFGVNMIDDSLFECIAPSRKYKFFDLFRDSKGWAKTVKLFLIHAQDEMQELPEIESKSSMRGGATKRTKAASKKKKKKQSHKHVLSLSSFIFSLELDPTLAFLKQGLLFKRRAAPKGKSANQKDYYGWASRWFILHGAVLYWFTGNGEGKPRGKIVVGAQSKIVSSAERDFCFKLSTPLFSMGVLLAATSMRDKHAWTRSLNRIINRSKAKEGSKRLSRLSQDTNKTWHARMISMAPAKRIILSGSQNLSSLKQLSSLKEKDAAERSSYAQHYDYGFDSEPDSDDGSSGPSGPESNKDSGAAGPVETPQVHSRNRSLEHLYLDKKDSSPVLF
jgi:hypothetical protein